jgi:hypothetical protein
MPQFRTVLAAAFVGIAVPACAEQVQVAGSPIVLDLPNGFTAARGGLENKRLNAQVRIVTDQSFVHWEQFFRVSARAYRKGNLNRPDPYLYFYYFWPDTKDAEFNVVFTQAGITAKVLFEVDTGSILKNTISFDAIERSLAGARVVSPAAPATPAKP